MRAQRLAELAKKDGPARPSCGRRRRASCSRSSISFNLRVAVRHRGGARQAEDGRPARPGAARRLHVLPPRDAADRRRSSRCSICSSSCELQYPPIGQVHDGARRRLHRLLPAEPVHREPDRRSASSRSSRRSRTALDMLLICVQSGMSIEAAFGKVAKEVAQPVARAGRGAQR